MVGVDADHPKRPNDEAGACSHDPPPTEYAGIIPEDPLGVKTPPFQNTNPCGSPFGSRRHGVIPRKLTFVAASPNGGCWRRFR